MQISDRCSYMSLYCLAVLYSPSTPQPAIIVDFQCLCIIHNRIVGFDQTESAST